MKLSYLKEHFSLFDMQIKHIYVTMCHIVHNELSEKVIYLCYSIDKRNHLKIYMFGVVGETHIIPFN